MCYYIIHLSLEFFYPLNIYTLPRVSCKGSGTFLYAENNTAI